MKIYLFLFASLLFACNNRDEVHEINDIERDTVFIYKSYSAYRTNIFLKITGRINDTAFIYGILIPPGNVNISGNYDYYNPDSIIIPYRAYRATKGNLKIQFK